MCKVKISQLEHAAIRGFPTWLIISLTWKVVCALPTKTVIW